MKKLLVLNLILGGLMINSAFGQYYYLNDTEKTAIFSTDPFYDETPFDHRAKAMDVTVFTTNQITAIKKADWAVLAQETYTNGLTYLGFQGAWTNMDVTFEQVGAVILQRMGQYLSDGDIESATALNTWVNLINSCYDSLLKYTLAYGNDDMRLYPYDSMYIYYDEKFLTVILYNGIEYIKQ